MQEDEKKNIHLYIINYYYMYNEYIVRDNKIRG